MEAECLTFWVFDSETEMNFCELEILSPTYLLQMRGECVENFITSAQDRSKNAHVKSMQAAFAAWVEQLRSDEVQFESQQIMWLAWT